MTTSQASLFFATTIKRTYLCRAWTVTGLLRQRTLVGCQSRKKSSVYTRTGDKGTSSLYSGERRPKSDNIFHALGDVDELNSSIGIAHHYCKKAQNGLEDRLIWIQCKLIELSSNIATPRTTSRENKLSHTAFDPTSVDTLESWIDELDAQLPLLKNFILPSGGESAIFLHQCRSICRRAERATVDLTENGTADPDVQRYLNRLSDFFFVAARYAAKVDGAKENYYEQRRKDKESILVTRELKEDNSNS
ncbi:8447_t:CDS:2 [Ambispora gerdemannii]|uniref:Corrinoid adenosyltransferase MMAB n=1 Tax=Ambispora gerdemannii TaxID=144530 RepID=A0A9N8WTG4_9GLOM|nr:8447_t:CDS:2 [Ambispora gerdemannii]